MNFTTFKTNLTYDNNTDKKVIKPPSKWSEITLDNMDNYNKNGNATCVICGEVSNVSVIDFDTDKSYEDFIELNPHLKECKTIKTNKGFHLYFLYTDKLKTTTNTTTNIDIRNNKSFVIAPPTKYIINDEVVEYKDLGGELFEYDNELDIYYDTFHPTINKNYLSIPPKKKYVKKEAKKEEIILDDLPIVMYVKPTIQSYIDLIDIEYIDNYSSWFNIVLALKKMNVDIEVIKELSKKSIKYTEEGFYTAYNTYNNSSITLNIGTIKMYAKQSNLIEYNLLHICNLLPNTDTDIANKFMELFEGDFVYSNKTLYVFHDNKWKKDNNFNVIKVKLTNVMTQYANDYLNSMKILYKDNSKCFIKAEQSHSCFIKNVSNNKSINDIIAVFKNNLQLIEINDIFDNHPYIFCFDNIAFDLQTDKTDKIVEINKQHFITQTTHYDYVEPTTDEMDRIHNMICQIFPNEEVRQSVLSIYFSGMIGVPAEKFILFNGKGRNGKGLLNLHYSNMLGDDYSKKFNSTLLINSDKSANEASPIIAQFDKIRYAFVEEFPDDSKLNLNNVKLLSGGGDLKARDLYKSVSTITNHLTIVMECNQRPQMNGKITQSITDRFIDIHFESYFTQEAISEDDINIFPLNEELKSTHFRNKHRSALFKYILMNAKKQIYIPKIVKDRGLEYIEDSDEIIVWLKENYNKTEGCFSSIKDIYNNFKQSEVFNSTYKKMKLINFKGHIQSNPLTQKDTYERKKINKVEYYNILFNWEAKPNEPNE